MSVPRYEEGEHVFVIDAGFDGECVKLGRVVDNQDRYDSMEVSFTSDPYDSGSDEQRTLTVVPEQCLRVDASEYETLVRTGQDDLIDTETKMRVDVITDVLDRFEYEESETERSDIMSGAFEFSVRPDHVLDVREQIERTGVWRATVSLPSETIIGVRAEYTGDDS
jgi:hypothetical protein